MATDREILKAQQKGTFRTAKDIVDSATAVVDTHKRSMTASRATSENAATNVSETPIGVVKRLSKLRAFQISPAANVANDNTNHVVVYLYKYNATSLTRSTIATYNSATAAQGIAPLGTATSGSIATETIEAGSPVSYHVGKFGSGQTLNTFSVTLDLEEV